MKKNLLTYCLTLLMFVFISSCASVKSNSIENFSENQKTKISEAEVYHEADFIFWAAAYVPKQEDLESLKASWIEYAESFPKSRSISDIEDALKNGSNSVVLVSLFSSEYELADLKNKSLGWAVGPVPKDILELDEKDVPLRTLMPVKNNWARFFLVKFDRGVSLEKVVISKREYKVNLFLK